MGSHGVHLAARKSEKTMRTRHKKQDDRIIELAPGMSQEGWTWRRCSSSDSKDDRTRRLLSMLRARRIPVQRVPKDRLDRITKKNHQGIVAFAGGPCAPRPSRNWSSRASNPGTGVPGGDDGVTDVGNLEGHRPIGRDHFGATGLVLQDHHAAPVNEDAIKTSGALNCACRWRGCLTSPRAPLPRTVWPRTHRIERKRRTPAWRMHPF